LHQFWAMHWHQLLRRTFLLTGGYPMQCLFGRPGLILGTFMSSGALHAIMVMGDGMPYFSWATFFFFSIQALGLALERQWRYITGSRVGGPIGSVWVVVWLFVTVHQTAGVWISRGALSTRLLPSWLSIANYVCQVVLPSRIIYTGSEF